MRYLVITLLFAAAVFAASEPEVYYLDNGMQVALIENHAAPVIASSIVVHTGLRDEPLEIVGASHFLEHLLFNGTTTRTQEQLYEEIDRLGAYNNAHTGENFTNFVILADKEKFAQALEIQADMVFNSTIPSAKFDKEKGIVSEEIGQSYDQSSYMADVHFASRFYRGTPYAFQVLGTKQSIKNMPRSEVWDYYKSHYIPNNMTVMITGDFTRQEIKPIVEKYLGAAVPGKLPCRPAYHPGWNEAPGIAKITFNYEKTKSIYLRTGMLVPGRAVKEYYSAEVLRHFLAKKLDKTLTGGEKQLVQSFSLDYFSDRDFGAFVLGAQLNSEENIRPVIDSFVQALNEMGKKPVSPDDIKSYVITERSQSLFDSERPHFWAMMKSYLLGFDDFEFVINYYDKLGSVTPEEVKNLADNLSKNAAIVPSVVLPYPTKTDTTKSETSNELYDKKLANGIEIVVVPGSGSGVFAAHLLFKGRSLREPAGKTGLTNFLHNMLVKGAGNMDEEALQAAMDKLGMKVEVTDNPFVPFDDYWTSPEFSFVRMQVPEENWKEALNLLAEIIKNPRLTSENLEQVQGELIGGAARSGESASSKSRMLFNKKLLGENVLAKDVSGNMRTLGGITLDDVKNYYKEYFAADNLIISVVSEAPAQEIAGKIETLFGSMKPAGIVAPASPLPAFEPGEFREKLGKKQSSIRIGYLLENIPEEDRAPLQIASSLLSDNMSFELRERQGLAYSMGAGVNIESGWGYFVASMGTAPDNIDKALTGMKSEIAKAAEGRYSDKEVEKTVNSLMGRENMRVLTSANRAFYMGISAMKGEPLMRHFADIQSLSGVKAGDVNRCAKKYFRTDNMLIVVVE